MDVDLGVLATRGAVRLGVTARNLREPRFGDRRLPRQVRAGAAFDGAAAGTVARDGVASTRTLGGTTEPAGTDE